MLLAPASLRVDVPEGHGVPCSRGGRRAPSRASSPCAGTRGSHPLSTPPVDNHGLGRSARDHLRMGWAPGVGRGAVMRRQDPTCSVLWSQGPRVEAPAYSSPSSPSRLGLASLQLQPHPPGRGPQPACWALVAPDTAPARALATSPAQHPHLGGVVTGGEAGEGPERRQRVVGPQRPDRRSQNGQRTCGRKGTGSERTRGRGSLMAPPAGWTRPLVEKAGPVHTRLPAGTGPACSLQVPARPSFSMWKWEVIPQGSGAPWAQASILLSAHSRQTRGCRKPQKIDPPGLAVCSPRLRPVLARPAPTYSTSLVPWPLPP